MRRCVTSSALARRTPIRARKAAIRPSVKNGAARFTATRGTILFSKRRTRSSPSPFAEGVTRQTETRATCSRASAHRPPAFRARRATSTADGCKGRTLPQRERLATRRHRMRFDWLQRSRPRRPAALVTSSTSPKRLGSSRAPRCRTRWPSGAPRASRAPRVRSATCPSSARARPVTDGTIFG